MTACSPTPPSGAHPAGRKRPTAGEIAASLGQQADSSLKRMLRELVRLEYLEEERDFEAPSNRAIRYRLADPAQRFHYGFVLPNESTIASAGAEVVWRERLAPQAWPAYVGFEVFQDVVRQAYLRFGASSGLPSVEEWGRWEGRDRAGEPIEIDVVTRLLDAASGRSWAHDALEPDASMLFVATGGFADSFHEVAAGHGASRCVTWTLENVYPDEGKNA